MLLLAAALYTVTALTIPGVTDAFAVPSFLTVAASAPPSSIALSASGSFAALVSGNDESGIVVIRTDGTRIRLNRPPDALLANVFGVYVEGQRGERTYPDARIEGIALANDGTPFATVDSPFSGAYIGMQRSVFIWNAARWREALPNRKLRTDAPNVALGATESPTRFAANLEYSASPMDHEEVERDPNYQRDAALLVDGPSATPLGHGAATAMRGAYVVGYDAGIQSVGTSYGRPSTALRWTGGRRAALGPGIAYGVNSKGEAVGENNPYLSDAGAPMLWSGHRAIRLSDRSGAAYAIADDGTVVGTVSGHAFLMRGRDRARKLLRLDALVRERDWNLTAAYAIAASGRIMAIGRNRAGPLRVLLLDPLEHS